MRAIWIAALALVAVVATAVLLTAGAAARPTGQARSASTQVLKMPLWRVTGKPVTREKADTLMQSLGTFDNGLQENGSIFYADPDKFLGLPEMPADNADTKPDEGGMDTDPSALDLESIKALTVIPADEAIENTEMALADAQLEPLDGAKGVTRTLMTANSFFDVFFEAGTNEPALHEPIDTVAFYDVKLGTKLIPLIGPGQKVRIAYDGNGDVTDIAYSEWSLRQGPNAVIIPQAQATQLATAQYRNQCGGAGLKSLKLDPAQMVYFAPSLDTSPKMILPYYQYGGTGRSAGEVVQLRQVLIPAVQNAPKVTISGNANGRAISARALVNSGTPPYSFQWESCASTLPADSTGQSIKYTAGGRASSNKETLIVHVTDANGASTSASKTFTLPRATAAATREPSVVRVPQTIPRLDVGAETVGTAMGLPGCIPDTTGFVGRMGLAGVPTQFAWYNTNAWEQDFKDPSRVGGDDSSFADDVDATFYCGHANGNGFSFPGAHTDGSLSYPDALWGNRDLEWLGIAACGPLQTTAAPDWWQRWGPAFDGLHLLLGYQTTSYDATGEGWDWANYMTRPWWWGGSLTVRQSWVQMAINNQPSSVQWAVMGVFGSGGVSNWSDYFWGYGATGPDLFPPFTGYWKVSGPS